MTEKEIRINSLAKTFGTGLISAGIKMVRTGLSGLVPQTKPYGFIHDSIAKIKNMPTGEKDMTYYLTTKENWEEIFNLIYGIVKNFPWQAEKFDCDDRSKLVSALCSVLFGLNSCGICYCSVKSLTGTGFTGNHFNNMVVTQQGEVILWDVDNGGLYRILKPGVPISFGVWQYQLFSTAF